MAINPASSIKSIGLLTLGVSGTGLGVYYREEIWEMFNSDFQTYLVQVVEKPNTEKEIKNDYRCRFDKKVDKNCSLSSFDFNSQKFVNSDEIFYAKDFVEKQLTENTFYKLSINERIVENIKIGSEIDLIDSKEVGSPSVFGKLKAVAKINSDFSQIPNNMLLMKADSSIFSTAAITNFKCKAKNSDGSNDVELECKIYKLNNSPKNIPFIDFSNLTEVKDLKEIQANQYYVVDFSSEDEAQKTNLITSNFSKIELWNPASPGKVESTLSFKSKLFGKFDEKEKADNFAFLFSKENKNKSTTSTYILGASVKGKNETSATTLFINKNENYKCKFNSIVDEDCQIVEVPPGQLNLLAITKKDQPPTKEKIHDGTTIYKIIAKNDLINGITKWDGTEEIEIIDKSNSQKFGAIHARYLIENQKLIKGKTNAFLVKANSIETKTQNIDTKTNYKCKWNSEESKCTISKFKEQPIVDDANLSTTKINGSTPVDKFDDLKQNDYYIIRLSNKQISLTENTKNTFTLQIEIVTTTTVQKVVVDTEGTQENSVGSTQQTVTQNAGATNSRQKRSTGAGQQTQSIPTSSVGASPTSPIIPSAPSNTPVQKTKTITETVTTTTYEDLGAFETVLGIFYKKNNPILL